MSALDSIVEAVPAQPQVVRSLSQKIAPALLLLADLVGWGGAFWLTVLLLPESVLDWLTLFFSPVVGVFGLFLVGGYDRRTQFVRLNYFSEHMIASAGAALGAVLFTYVVSSYNESIKPSRLLLPTAFAIWASASLMSRRMLGARWMAQRARLAILVLGDGEAVRSFNRDYQASRLPWSLRLVGLEDTAVPAHLDGPESPRVEGNLQRVLELEGLRFQMILLACNPETLGAEVSAQLAQLHCKDVPVLTVDAFHEQQWRRVHVGAVRADWLFACEFRLARGTVYSQLKRLFDVVFSACALVVLSPVLLVAAALISTESRGGAIFRQARVGRDGRVFTILKLRTMRENEGDIYTREGDTRVTRIGRWLRMSRLDEVPQLWNVLRGEMSLIGPRAEWVRCAEVYQGQIPNYHLRHLVHPGITGWAQVNFRYGEGREDAVEKFQYDLYYIRHFSLQLDLSIVVKTVYTMLSGGGR